MTEPTKEDWIRSLLVLAVMFMLLMALCAVTAHCMDPSQQTIQETLSIYIKHCNPRLDPSTRRHIAAEIICQCHNAEVPWEVIAAIMKVESYYDPTAIGPMGEIGLMQIYTTKCAGVEFNKALLFDIGYNITAGICIFLSKLVMAEGDYRGAIMLYNGQGPSAEKFRKRVYGVIFDIFRFRVAISKKEGIINASGY